MAAGSGGGGGFSDPGWQGKPFPLITSGMWDESRGGHTYCIDGVEVPAYMALILIRSNAVDWGKSWVGRRMPGHWERRDLPGGNAGEVTDFKPGEAGEWRPVEVVAYYEWVWVPDLELIPIDRGDVRIPGELTAVLAWSIWESTKNYVSDVVRHPLGTPTPEDIGGILGAVERSLESTPWGHYATILSYAYQFSIMISEEPRYWGYSCSKYQALPYLWWGINFPTP